MDILWITVPIELTGVPLSLLGFLLYSNRVGSHYENATLAEAIIWLQSDFRSHTLVYLHCPPCRWGIITLLCPDAFRSKAAQSLPARWYCGGFYGLNWIGCFWRVSWGFGHERQLGPHYHHRGRFFWSCIYLCQLRSVLWCVTAASKTCFVPQCLNCFSWMFMASKIGVQLRSWGSYEKSALHQSPWSFQKNRSDFCELSSILNCKGGHF